MKLVIQHPSGENLFYVSFTPSEDVSVKIGEEVKSVKANESFEWNGNVDKIEVSSEKEFNVVGMANYNWIFTLYSQE
jgi:hypothetical protein